MEGTAEVPATALWATSASFNRHITASVCRIRVSTKLLRAVSLTTVQNVAPLLTVVILERCVSIAKALPTPRAFLRSPRHVRILLHSQDLYLRPSLYRLLWLL